MSSDSILVFFLILPQFPSGSTLLIVVSGASAIYPVLFPSLAFFFSLPSYASILCVGGERNGGVHARRNVSVTVREQLATVTCQLLPCAFWGSNSSNQTWQTWNCITDPLLFSLNSSPSSCFLKRSPRLSFTRPELCSALDQSCSKIQ